MHPRAMTIPANIVDGQVVRPTITGPVFSQLEDGNLHMRYTHRKHNIQWRDDKTTKQALGCLSGLLDNDNPYCFETKLQSGQGLICNNILHTRSGFNEGSDRLLYRGRYFNRLNADFVTP